jgi:hypothetical protein
MDNQKEHEDKCEADDESDTELFSAIRASECPEHRVVHAAQNVAGLIRPTRESMNLAEKGLVMVSAMETWRIM